MEPDLKNLHQLFSQARSELMLPHTRGEANSIAASMMHCAHALRETENLKILGSESKRFVEILEHAMNTKGIIDVLGQGTWRAKAELLSPDDRADFSRAVDELAGLSISAQLWELEKEVREARNR